MSLLLVLLTVAQDPQPWERPHGFSWNTGPIQWNGWMPHATGLFGVRMGINESDLAFDVSGTPFRFQYGNEQFGSVGLGIQADFTLLRLDVQGVWGRWAGDGRMFNGTAGTEGDADIGGDLFGAKATLRWPALVYHGQAVDLSFGPSLSGLFLYQETSKSSAESLSIGNDVVRDTFTQSALAAGIFFAYELPLGSVKLIVEVGVEIPFAGDLEPGAIIDVLIGPKFGWTF